jgi:cysteine desulfurase
MGIDVMSFSSHKLYGPKGVGALYVRRRNPRVRLAAQMDGGGHERGMRSGTLPVPLIVGFGEACRIAGEIMPAESARLTAMRERLYAAITKGLDEVYLNGHPTQRLPHNLNISFAYVEGEAMLMGLKDIALSSGSACTSATLEPSYVLRSLAHSSIRFGLGRFNTDEEIDFVAERVIQAVTKLREMSPLYEMAKEGIDLKAVNWSAH